MNSAKSILLMLLLTASVGKGIHSDNGSLLNLKSLQQVNKNYISQTMEINNSLEDYKKLNKKGE